MLLHPTCIRGLRASTPLSSLVRRWSAVAEAAVNDAESGDPEWATARPYSDIPGPKPLPIVGNLWRFIPGIGEYSGMDPYKLQKAWRNEFGPISRISNLIIKKDMVMVAEPELCEKVFRNEGKWPVREGVDTIPYYRTVMRKEWFGEWGAGLMGHGEEWHKTRTRVNQPLMQPASARRYLKPINEVTDEFITRMREMRDEQHELPADFVNELYKWALESIAVITLDTRLGCLAADLKPGSEPQKLIDAVQIMFEGIYELDIQPSLWKLISTPTWRRYIRALDYFHEVSEKYIHQAMGRDNQDSSEDKSILQRLSKVDRKLAQIMVADMISAGIDTTSNTAAVLLFLLANNPEKQEILRKEIFEALRDSPQQPITEETLNKMSYLKACLKESQRILPIAIGNMRTLPKDIVLRGYQVPKGTLILMANMLMGHEEKHYPEPDKFLPERWLRGHEQAHTAHRFVTMPFGFGSRMCVGRRFAELEVQFLVAKIIRNFKMEYHYGPEMEYVNRAVHVLTTPLKFQIRDV